MFVDYSTEWRECSIVSDDERYSLWSFLIFVLSRSFLCRGKVL